LLSKLYEEEIRQKGIEKAVIAYRRIVRADGQGGKCNIDFAKDAFEDIRNYGECFVIALDIEKFFDRLDHEHIKFLWWRLLGFPKQKNNNWTLPKDHFKVFRAVTAYSYIPVEAAYKKLKLIDKTVLPSGREVFQYKEKREDFPKQICSPEEFRTLLLPLMKHNDDGFGIPQGSPISDVIANLYMIDFDQKLDDYIKSLGGKYYRYSDDILIIIPGTSLDWQQIQFRVNIYLTNHSPRRDNEPLGPSHSI